jgi:hypothetical protein
MNVTLSRALSFLLTPLYNWMQLFVFFYSGTHNFFVSAIFMLFFDKMLSGLYDRPWTLQISVFNIPSFFSF